MAGERGLCTWGLGKVRDRMFRKGLFILAHQCGDISFYPTYKKLVKNQWKPYAELKHDQEFLERLVGEEGDDIALEPGKVTYAGRDLVDPGSAALSGAVGWRCLQRIRDNGNHNIEERYSVLVTPVGAIPNVIIDGKTGCIMENNSFECIVENVIRALNSPHLEENA